MDLGEYNKHKHKFQTGDRIVTQSNTFPSLLIRILTKSYWSHVLTVVVLDELPSQIFLIQASHDTGVILVEATRYLQNLKGVAAWIPLKHDLAHSLNPDYKKDIVLQGFGLIGLGFDMPSIWVGLIKRVLGPMARPLIWMFPRLYESFYCSALSAWLMMKARLRDDYKLTPQEIVTSTLSEEAVPLYPNC